MLLRAKHQAVFPRIRFFTYAHGEIPVFDEKGRTPLLSVTTQKRLGGPSGAFEMRLKPVVMGGEHDGKIWTDLLDDSAHVAIDVIRDGVTFQVLLGKVDTVGISVGSSGAGVGTTITVSGRDMGYVLEDTQVYFNPYDPVHDNALGIDMLRIIDAKIAGKPHEFLVNLIAGMLGRRQGIALLGGHTQIPDGIASSPGSFWIDLLDTETAVQTDLRGLVFAPQVLTAEDASTLWDYIEAWRNPAFNEVWVDTAPLASDRRVYLHLRERPFVNAGDEDFSPWFSPSLATHQVSARYLIPITLNFGMSRVNHVTLTGELFPQLGKDAYAIYSPFIDIESIQRFGIRKLEEQTRYIDDHQYDAGFGSEYAKWVSLVISWNCLNHLMWHGELSLGEFRPEISVGHKIFMLDGPPGLFRGLPRDEGDPLKAMSFYVEGVTHEIIGGAEPRAQTRLTVTQGYVEGRRVADTVVAHNRFKGRGVDLTRTGTANTGKLDAAADQVRSLRAGDEVIV